MDREHMTDHPHTRCRFCDSQQLQTFLDLGAQPPANALLRDPAQPEKRYPLAVARCKVCELVQLTHVVAPEVLFRDYVYFSSVSATMSQHFAAYAADVAERFVPRDGLVVEIGSNDGVLLRTLLDRPLRVLGVDPARNVAEVARSRGVPTIAELFTSEVADRVRREHGPASAILANNVFAHIDDIRTVMLGIDRLLDDRGVFVIEAPYLVDLIERLAFDTIYHEHASYLALRPLARLPLEIFDVQRQPVHGGSIRVFLQRPGGPHTVQAVVGELLAQEGETLAEPRLVAFAARVAALRDELRARVNALRAEGKRVVGYAAAAKATVLLNYCGLDLDYVVDATPAKQNLYIPGVHIPIRSPEHFRADRPDVALLFAWNLRDEIFPKEAAWRAAGGRFLIPLPSPELA